MPTHPNAFPPKSHGLLTLAQAASELDRSERTVWRWIQLGRIPGVRLGGRWFVHRDDLARFLRSGGTP